MKDIKYATLQCVCENLCDSILFRVWFRYGSKIIIMEKSSTGQNEVFSLFLPAVVIFSADLKSLLSHSLNMHFPITYIFQKEKNILYHFSPSKVRTVKNLLCAFLAHYDCKKHVDCVAQLERTVKNI